MSHPPLEIIVNVGVFLLLRFSRLMCRGDGWRRRFWPCYCQCCASRSSAFILRFLVAFHQGKDDSRFSIAPTLREQGFVSLNRGHELSKFGRSHGELLGVAMGSLTQFFCGHLQLALRVTFEACVMLRNAFDPSMFEKDVGMPHVVGIVSDWQLRLFQLRMITERIPPRPVKQLVDFYATARYQLCGTFGSGGQGREQEILIVRDQPMRTHPASQ